MSRTPISNVTALAGAILLVTGAAAPAAAGGPTFLPAAPMHAARSFHSATLLPDGRVLAAGGFNARRMGPPILSEAELYDPSTDTWTRTGSMREARAAHVVVLLDDGRVLVAGGLTNGPPPPAPPVVLASAELYDPAAGTWSLTGSMRFGREDASITLLRDGRVLVAGGSTGGPTGEPRASAELFDPGSGTWKLAAEMSVPRVDHIAVLLRKGQVLVAGGRGPLGALASAEVYDPELDEWQAAAEMSTARDDAEATRLPDGRVLVSGGELSPTQRLASAEVYDPEADQWTPTENDMSQPRVDHVSVLLSDGTVLSAGGFAAPETPTASADIYNPATNQWEPAGPMTTVRGGPVGTLLEDGTVLITGGLVAPGTATETTETFGSVQAGAARAKVRRR